MLYEVITRIAAEDKVEISGRRLAKKIMTSERNGTDHVIPQAVPFFLFTEIPVRNLPGDLAKTAFRVKSLSGTFETLLVDVGCENGKVRLSTGEFLPKDPEGKRFRNNFV